MMILIGYNASLLSYKYEISRSYGKDRAQNLPIFHKNQFLAPLWMNSLQNLKIPPFSSPRSAPAGAKIMLSELVGLSELVEPSGKTEESLVPSQRFLVSPLPKIPHFSKKGYVPPFGSVNPPV